MKTDNSKISMNEKLDNLANLGVLLGVHEVDLLADIQIFLDSTKEPNLGSLEDFLNDSATI